MTEVEEVIVKKKITPSLRDRVYYAARDGMAITLFSLLYENKSVAQDLLDEVSCTFFFYNICFSIYSHTKF